MSPSLKWTLRLCGYSDYSFVDSRVKTKNKKTNIIYHFLCASTLTKYTHEYNNHFLEALKFICKCPDEPACN